MDALTLLIYKAMFLIKDALAMKMKLNMMLLLGIHLMHN